MSALAALWASVRGLRVRARNIIYATAHQNPEYYRLWISAIEPEKVAAFCQGLGSHEKLPPIIALVFRDQHRSAKAIAKTVTSIIAALGEAATIYCDSAGADGKRKPFDLPRNTLGDLLNRPNVADPNAWLLPVMAGDEIAPQAGKALIRALTCSPESEIIYWDEDRLDGRIRHEPWLKPDWDELLFLARDTLTGAGMFKISALLDPETGLQNKPVEPRLISQLVISVVNKTRSKPAAFHIPLILSHRRAGSSFASVAERRAAIEATWHEPIELAEIDGVPGALRPRFAAGESLPKVSIVIPTRNRHDLLTVCMAGLSRLEYRGDVEIMVVDNDSDDAVTLDYLEELASDGVTVLRYPGPFNFSAMINRAAEKATGELLCLLNNDIEMHDGEWLEAMVRHATRPGVGAVGALLQYPDGTVQHAGVSVGTGNAAGHAYRGTPLAATGHRDMHRLTRRVSAVTAACLVVRKEAFLEVGGLDESAFKVAFNDVDLCLKLLKKGYCNIFAGDAHLTHHESKSRGSDFSGENYSRYLSELAHLQERWGTKEFIDPYHHPLALRSAEKFVLAP